MVDSFHFIRPWWLLLLLPCVALVWRLWLGRDASRVWRKIIDPELLAVLMTGSSRQNPIRPVTLLAVVWLLGVFALAGPTWNLEPSPFSEDQAALVIVMKVTESMTEQDVQPTRAERAAQKIRDLLAQRRDARTALVAYAGSAHLVMPLTKDADIINTFASDLSPKTMPRAGNDAVAALALANAQLTHAGGGSIIFLTDSLPSDVRFASGKGATPVQVLGMIGTGGQPGLRATVEKAGGEFTALTADDKDVSHLAKWVKTSFLSRPDDGDTATHWRDRGWWLTIVIAGLGLWWFRPGWVIGWN